MRNILFNGSVSPAENRKLQLLENRFGVELPRQLKDWFRTNDGGFPSSENEAIDKTQIPDSPSGIYIGQFFSVDEVLDTMDAYGARIQYGYVPVGEDGSGNLIVVSLIGEDREGVYFWDHELERAAYEQLGRRIIPETNLFRISNTFGDFLDLLGAS